MARLSNEDIKNMSIHDATNYAFQHPAESGRISKLFFKESTKCAKVSLQYTTSTLFKPNPDSITIEVNS